MLHKRRTRCTYQLKRDKQLHIYFCYTIMKLYVSILVMLLCIACSQQQHVVTGYIEGSAPTLFYLESQKQPDDKRFDRYRVVDIIRLETSDDCLLNSVQQVEVVDSLFIVLDYSNKLFVFNKDGHFKNTIGSRGEGPDQYAVISGFYIHNDSSIVILDDYKSCMKEYSLEGRFISSTLVELEDIQNCKQALPMGRHLLLYNWINRNENMAYSVFDLETNQLSGRYFPYGITTNRYLYSFAKHPMAVSDHGIDFILPLCDTIYTYKNSIFQAKFLIKHPWKTAGRHLITPHTKSYNADLYELNRKGFFTGFTSLYETDKHLLLEYKESGCILGFLLFDKSSHQGNAYLYSVSEKTKSLHFSPVIGTTRHYFLSALNSDFARTIGSQIEASNEAERKLKLWASTIKDEDNPCLIIYEILP